MKIRFTLIVVLLLLIFGSSLYVVKSTSAEANVTPSDPELMAQGKIRSCLKGDYVGETPHGKAVNQNTKIRLTGKCGAPSGCKIIVHQYPNGNMAREDELTSAPKTADAQRESYSPQKIAQMKKNGKCNPNRTSRRTGKNCGDCSCQAEDVNVGIRHGLRDVRDPILSALKESFYAVTSFTNNLLGNPQANLQQKSNNVLGVADSGMVPYGDVDVTIDIPTYRHSNNDFVAEGEASPIVELGSGAAEGEAKTQQLSTISFDFEKIEGAKSDCTTISWDPYGRVFDAVSLEPISDVEVTLLDPQTDKPVEMQYEDNFDITGEDGVFNILVEKEGSYKLDAYALSDHNFSPNPKPNQYWSKIYSDLYSPGNSFFEKVGVATHHDIALIPAGEPYRGAVVEMVDGTFSSKNMGSYITYVGRVTFPYAKVCLVSEKSKKVVGKCANANNIGKFVIVLEKSQVPQERLLVKGEKVDLTNPNTYKTIQTVETLNAGSYVSTGDEVMYFEPVLSHLEGYAYDKEGGVIPGAAVKLITEYDDKLFYQTKADDSGFFTVYSKNLPYVEYYISITDPNTGASYVKTPSQFVTDNKSYLESKKINLMTAEKNNQSLVNPQTGELNQIPDPINTGNQDKELGANSSNNPIKLEVIAVAFVIVILIIGALGVVIYIKRQNKASA